MLNSRPILKVIQSGTSFVCAHCEHFWWGVDNRYEGCKAIHDHIECSGPLRGMAFPNYKGPLEGHLSKYCFVCGHTPDATAIAREGGARVGVCTEHIKLMESFSAPGERPPFITHVHVPVVT